nr:protein TRACHEARY ELEMENT DIFFERENTIATION-RELATED 7A-like [Lolium perenne]
MPPPQPQQPPSHPAHTGPPPRHPKHRIRPRSLAGEVREGGHRLAPETARPRAAHESPSGPVRAPPSPATPAPQHHRRAPTTTRPRATTAALQPRRPPSRPAHPRPPHLDALGRAPPRQGTREGEKLPRRHLPRARALCRPPSGGGEARERIGVGLEAAAARVPPLSPEEGDAGGRGWSHCFQLCLSICNCNYV